MTKRLGYCQVIQLAFVGASLRITKGAWDVRSELLNVGIVHHHAEQRLPELLSVLLLPRGRCRKSATRPGRELLVRGADPLQEAPRIRPPASGMSGLLLLLVRPNIGFELAHAVVNLGAAAPVDGPQKVEDVGTHPGR